MTENLVAHVPKPNPLNKRGRIVSVEEWERPKATLPPHLRRVLTIEHDVGTRKGAFLNLDWCIADKCRKEFTLRWAKNGEMCVVPLTPALYDVFAELRREWRLDSHRVFLYNEKPIQRLGSVFVATCQLAGIADLRICNFRIYDKHQSETNRYGYGHRDESCGGHIRPNASAVQHD